MKNLNPWHIEINKQKFDSSVDVRIINVNSGEIKYIRLTVDDISNIETISPNRLAPIAELMDTEKGESDLDVLIGYDSHEEIIGEEDE